jgi:hypothetical protein
MCGRLVVPEILKRAAQEDLTQSRKDAKKTRYLVATLQALRLCVSLKDNF